MVVVKLQLLACFYVFLIGFIQNDSNKCVETFETTQVVFVWVGREKAPEPEWQKQMDENTEFTMLLYSKVKRY